MDGTAVKFEVKGSEPKPYLFRSMRRMLVGPWLNQPEYYEGYNGFVGWAGISRQRSGRWLLTFTSGYWHFSPPMTPSILEDKACSDQFGEWREIGMPYIAAPRGGRAHLMTSEDRGITWEKPAVLIDTVDDDRHPTILELDDGTLLCTFFTGRMPRCFDSWHMHSTDNGKTWSEPAAFPWGSNGGFGNGSAIQLKNGRVLCEVGGSRGSSEVINIFASDDRGRSFSLLSQLSGVEGNEGSSESGICELDDGRLVMLSRRMGPVRWSGDGGATWSPPLLFGIDIYDPHLLLFPNGVLACFHGSYTGGGLRVILSRDGGATWHGPVEGTGYSIDPSVYGYSHPMLLEDGTVYIVYIHTGGHTQHDARTEALWALRVRPYDDASGIELLPASQENGISPKGSDQSGGDPELGNLF